MRCWVLVRKVVVYRSCRRQTDCARRYPGFRNRADGDWWDVFMPELHQEEVVAELDSGSRDVGKITVRETRSFIRVGGGEVEWRRRT